MSASAQVSSSKPGTGQGITDTPLTHGHWDLGPELNPLGEKQRQEFIKKSAWKYHSFQITIMGLIGLALVIGVLFWDVLRPPIFLHNVTEMPPVNPSNWAEWWIRMQSFLGIGTLLVALFVWYGRIREEWEKDLPSRMSIFFFHDSKPAIVCRYIWLAGSDDLRAWGQQIAGQAAGERFLDFSPDVEAQGPSLMVGSDGSAFKHYALCFQLTKLPPSLEKESGVCRYQNLASDFKGVSSVPVTKVESLKVVKVWEKVS